MIVRFLLTLVVPLVFCIPQVACAEVVFSVSKVSPGPISLGDSAVFEVLAKTKSGTQNFSIVGFDVGLSRLDGAGGVFTSYANYIGGTGWFIDSTGTLGLYDGASGNGITQLTTSDTAIASITLSTSNPTVLLGDYSVSLSNIYMDDGALVITTSAAEPTTYTITSVPEPSAMLLVSACAIAAVGVRFRRRFSPSL